MSRISDTFQRLAAEGRAALIPYITAGYPDLATTAALLPALVASGADLVEIGIPFSDPLADGPTIQSAGQQALAAGTTIADIHTLVKTLREQGLAAPMLYMVYYNCVFRHGDERFVTEAAEAGVDGLIVPDLPLEEADGLEKVTRAAGLDLIYLLAPTSTDDRIAATAKRARSFIYCVSVTGVTGARDTLPPTIRPFLARIRQQTDVPLAVGFGVSTPEQAGEVAALADGVIVGSALIDRITRAARNGGDSVQAASEYMKSLRHGIDQARGYSSRLAADSVAKGVATGQ